jgi:hypothetical protein
MQQAELLTVRSYQRRNTAAGPNLAEADKSVAHAECVTGMVF